jgi:hypothetical protein
MPEQERSRVFKYLVPEQLRSGGTEAAALLDIAASLPPGKLIEAVRWMIVHYRHNDPELLLPFVQAALRHPPVDALEIWEEILAESARLPCSDAVSWLESALPLADALGGATALAGIDMLLAKIAEQWPDRVAIKQSD